jgi:hypothetical protein
MSSALNEYLMSKGAFAPHPRPGPPTSPRVRGRRRWIRRRQAITR